MNTFFKLALITASIAAVAVANANLVTNGDFESGAAGTFSVGSSSVPGWSIIGAANDNVYIAPNNYLGFFPTKSCDLSGYSDHTGQGIEQTLSNGAGNYQLKLDIGTFSYGNSMVDVIVDGVTLGSGLTGFAHAPNLYVQLQFGW